MYLHLDVNGAKVTEDAAEYIPFTHSTLKRISLLSMCNDWRDREDPDLCVPGHLKDETSKPMSAISDKCLDLRESKQPLEASGAALKSRMIKTRRSRTPLLSFFSILLHSGQVALKRHTVFWWKEKFYGNKSSRTNVSDLHYFTKSVCWPALTHIWT